MKTEPLSEHSKERIEYLFREWNKRVRLTYQCQDVSIILEGKPKVFRSIHAVMEQLNDSLYRRIDSHVAEIKILEDKLDFLNLLGADILLEDYEINLLSIVKELDASIRLFIIDNKLR